MAVKASEHGYKLGFYWGFHFCDLESPFFVGYFFCYYVRKYIGFGSRA